MNPESRVPINISARHVHLSREHVETLFGPGYQLQRKANLLQPAQFVCHETVTLETAKSSIRNVRVLGPERKQSQVEISRTDEIALGIDAPIRASGELEGSPGVTLVGPHGRVPLPLGVIQAQRHIHMSPDDARHFGLKDKDMVMVRVAGERGLIFDDVLVRVSDSYRLEMHVDTDEANAADLHAGGFGTVISRPTEVKPEPND